MPAPLIVQWTEMLLAQVVGNDGVLVSQGIDTALLLGVIGSLFAALMFEMRTGRNRCEDRNDKMMEHVPKLVTSVESQTGILREMKVAIDALAHRTIDRG